MELSLSRGQQYSFVLHAILMLFMIFGLPDFLHRRIESEPMAISVDILPIAPISNVKPQEQAPQPEKKPLEEKKVEKKPTVEAKKAEEKPQPKPEPLKKDVVKIPEKKVEKKVEKKKKTDDLESILKSVKETAKSEEAKKPAEKAISHPSQNKAISQTYDSTLPLSLSEKDAIAGQFKRCWNVPAGAKDAKDLVVTLHLSLSADGSVTNVEMARDQSRYNSDTYFRAAADSAMRAVRQCSPLKNLSADKYGSWHEMELTFDPKDML
jgi:outer membrane biosynthesis protein TonB